MLVALAAEGQKSVTASRSGAMCSAAQFFGVSALTAWILDGQEAINASRREVRPFDMSL